jgi:hypothetical protein
LLLRCNPERFVGVKQILTIPHDDATTLCAAEDAIL